VLLYVAILSILIFRRRIHLGIAVGLSVALIAADTTYWWHERWHGQALRITHLSVGHGDAAVVEFPGSRVLLIDAGGSLNPDFDTGDFIVAPFLRSRKILRVDYLFLSNAKVDHYGGMQTIATQFAPKEFWYGGAGGRTPRYERLETALDEARIIRLPLEDGAPCRVIEGVELCVLYPPETRSGDASVVLRLRYGRFDMLFAGDLEAKDEKLLVAARGGELQSAVVKAPHHGSPRANTDEFIHAVAPRLAIFSVGPRSAAAAKEVIDRYVSAGAEPLRTDRDGAVTIETDGKTLRYRSYMTGKSGEVGGGS
jgi:competence protein ComEC